MVPLHKAEQEFVSTIFGNEAAGAIPNLSRVVKRNSRPGDKTPDGSLGTVVGSIPHAEGVIDGEIVLHGYLVQWDRDPRNEAVFVIDTKIKLQDMKTRNEAK